MNLKEKHYVGVDCHKDTIVCYINGKHKQFNLCIDKTTILSPEQKSIVDVYTEKMKNPGLGIRNLHEQGITGKGVKMAIIDQPLGKHNEYSDNISTYQVTRMSM